MLTRIAYAFLNTVNKFFGVIFFIVFAIIPACIAALSSLFFWLDPLFDFLRCSGLSQAPIRLLFTPFIFIITPVFTLLGAAKVGFEEGFISILTSRPAVCYHTLKAVLSQPKKLTDIYIESIHKRAPFLRVAAVCVAFLEPSVVPMESPWMFAKSLS